VTIDKKKPRCKVFLKFDPATDDLCLSDASSFSVTDINVTVVDASCIITVQYVLGVLGGIVRQDACINFEEINIRGSHGVAMRLQQFLENF